jgi:hypothetical protein
MVMEVEGRIGSVMVMVEIEVDGGYVFGGRSKVEEERGCAPVLLFFFDFFGSFFCLETMC